MILWDFVGPNGVRVDLTGADGLDELGIIGAWMPEYDRLTRSIPGGSGEVTETSRAKPRTVTVPIVLQDTQQSARALDVRMRELADALAPEDGPGLLRATSLDDLGRPLIDPETGQPFVRVLRARYASGFEVDRTWGDSYGGWWQLAGLVFYADQPYYEPVQPRLRPYRSQAPVPWFPILPLVLGSDSALGASTERNDGAVEVFPVITVRRPGTSITATNLTTGQSWTVDTSGIDPSLDVTIDARPTYLGGGRTVTSSDGANLYPYLDGGLWPLVRGDNDLALSVAGATPGTTELDLAYSPLYRTPIAGP